MDNGTIELVRRKFPQKQRVHSAGVFFPKRPPLFKPPAMFDWLYSSFIQSWIIKSEISPYLYCNVNYNFIIFLDQHNSINNNLLRLVQTTSQYHHVTIRGKLNTCAGYLPFVHLGSFFPGFYYFGFILPLLTYSTGAFQWIKSLSTLVSANWMVVFFNRPEVFEGHVLKQNALVEKRWT